jgi:hypothetical protein
MLGKLWLFMLELDVPMECLISLIPPQFLVTFAEVLGTGLVTSRLWLFSLHYLIFIFKLKGEIIKNFDSFTI